MGVLKYVRVPLCAISRQYVPGLRDAVINQLLTHGHVNVCTTTYVFTKVQKCVPNH
jgi:hypothetical protein